MKLGDPRKIMRNPCNEDDQLANWSTTANNFQEIFQIIENITVGVDNFTVAVNQADKDANGADFLHPKLHDHGEYDFQVHALVKAQVIDDSTVRLVADLTTIQEFGSASNQILRQIGGEVLWTEADSVVDNFTVKVTALDLVASFLHDALEDHATYAAGADLLVASATVGEANTDQTERFFVDVDAIAGHSESGFLVLALVDGASEYTTVEDVGDYLLTVSAWIDALIVILEGHFTGAVEKYRLVRGKAVSPVSKSSTTFLIDEVVPLASGLDPVEGNPATQLRVANIHEDKYSDGDYVVAAYNDNVVSVPETDWEALPKTKVDDEPVGIIFTAEIDGEISPGSASAPVPGTGTVYEVDEEGSTVVLGERTLWNPFNFRVSGSCTTTSLGEGNHLIVGALPACGEYAKEVVTDVGCEVNPVTEEEEIAVTKEFVTFHYLDCSSS